MSETQQEFSTTEDWLSQFGLDLNLVLKALLIAIVSGILVALLDEILDLPAENLAVTLGGIIAALNGTTYASFKRCCDRSGLVMGIVFGWLAYMIWYFTLRIVNGDSFLIAGMDWFEATITGLVTGAFGFAWYAAANMLARRLSF